MRSVRIAVRLLVMAAVSLLLLPIPVSAALFTLGARGPTSRAGMFGMNLWCKVLCAGMGIRFDVKGTPPQGTCLYASNHSGYMDIIVLGSLYRSQFLSMAEVATWPGIGFLARWAGTLFIDRKKIRDIPRARQEMAFYLSRGMSITFFPEGKASCGATVETFRPSLFEVAVEAGVPIVPVTLSYSTAGSDPPSQVICWWGDMEFMPHFLNVLGMTGISVSVTFGEPILPGGDRKLLAKTLRERILRTFVPMRQTTRA